MEKIIIIGGGGLGKIVIDIIGQDGGYAIEGIIDASLTGKKVAGIKVIGTDDDLADILKGGISKAAFAIGGVSLDTNIERMRKYKKIEDEGFEIISVIQKDSYVSRTATLGAGNIIVGNCYIGPGVKLGSGVIMHPFTSVEHDSIIGDYVQLSQGVKIAGSAKIGKASFIGMGASIIQGAIMPEETFVKSGSIYR